MNPADTDDPMPDLGGLTPQPHPWDEMDRKRGGA